MIVITVKSIKFCISWLCKHSASKTLLKCQFSPTLILIATLIYRRKNRFLNKVHNNLNHDRKSRLDLPYIMSQFKPRSLLMLLYCEWFIVTNYVLKYWNEVCYQFFFLLLLDIFCKVYQEENTLVNRYRHVSFKELIGKLRIFIDNIVQVDLEF